MTGWLQRLERGPEAHLWYVQHDQTIDEVLLAPYRDLLTPAELERNGRFVFPSGRREHLITRALVRTTLSTYCPEVDPRDWQFAANQYGRPEIVTPRLSPTLCFNV